MNEIIKMSSKGQIVVPKELREELDIDAGTSFAIYGKNDTIILKKINIPDLKKQFEELVKYGKQHAKKLGIKTEEDVVRMIHEARGIKSD